MLGHPLPQRVHTGSSSTHGHLLSTSHPVYVLALGTKEKPLFLRQCSFYGPNIQAWALPTPPQPQALFPAISHPHCDLFQLLFAPNTHARTTCPAPCLQETSILLENTHHTHTPLSWHFWRRW